MVVREVEEEGAIRLAGASQTSAVDVRDVEASQVKQRWRYVDRGGGIRSQPGSRGTRVVHDERNPYATLVQIALASAQWSIRRGAAGTALHQSGQPSVI